MLHQDFGGYGGLKSLQKCWPCPVMTGTSLNTLMLHQDALDALVDMREYDVPYHMRFQIDTDVRCGHWFTVTAKVCDSISQSKQVAVQSLAQAYSASCIRRWEAHEAVRAHIGPGEAGIQLS